MRACVEQCACVNIKKKLLKSNIFIEIIILLNSLSPFRKVRLFFVFFISQVWWEKMDMTTFNGIWKYFFGFEMFLLLMFFFFFVLVFAFTFSCIREWGITFSAVFVGSYIFFVFFYFQFIFFSFSGVSSFFMFSFPPLISSFTSSLFKGYLPTK